MHPPRRSVVVLPPLALVAVLLAVYRATLAPGLTWANYGADGGDLVAAAATGGVAHPTGYPTYLLLARLFQFLPLGTLAFRTNLFSAVAAVGAALLVYLLVTRFLAPQAPHHYWLAGLVAGLSFGLAPLVWSQAVITEVYALNAFLMALILYLVESPATERLSQVRKDGLLGLIFGLGMGNHITLALLFPIILFPVNRRSTDAVGGRWSIRNLRFDLSPCLRRLLWTGLGLLIYLTLPLRAISKPPVDWGNPVTPAGFEWLVTGKLYQYQALITSPALLLERIRSWAAILLDQFGLIGLTLALVGLIVFLRPGRLYLGLLWIVLAVSVFAVVYSTNDSFVYLIPALLGFAIWLGIGVGRLADAIGRRWKVVSLIAGSAVLLLLLVQAGLHWKDVDASRDNRAEDFARAVLTAAPADAIVFAKGDQAIFSLWYYHYALHSRPDLAIMVSDLLQFDWYLQTLRNTYPALDLSEPFPFPETVIEMNPGRSVCYVEYVQIPVITCLPPRSLARP